MVIPITVRRVNGLKTCRPLSVVETRKRALERLYKRKLAVDDLIRSLEVYREAQRVRRCERLRSSAMDLRSSAMERCR
jgi:hypothetical protein